MRVDQIEIGEIFAGKYRVERVLGRGSMGVVVAATHLGLGRVVALKFMFGGGAQKAEQTARFRREAQVAAMLKSPHAGQVLDVGELDAETPYIVMEYLEGQDLAAVLKARGSLPVEEAISLILQACDAVAEAHSMGIVHRDLKPANLFVALDSTFCPCMKVLDFGVSKLGDAHLGLTQTGQMLGSPLYMSPEQINSSRDADARSDIWALGVILYELLAGTTPFHADRVLELYRKLSTEPPSPLERHRPDVAPGLCAVIMQSLEKDRDRRWPSPSVAAFAAALAPYAPAAAAPYVARIARVQRMDVEAQRTTASLERPPLLRRMALPAAGAGVMVDVVSSGHASAPLASAATEIPRPPSPLPGRAGDGGGVSRRAHSGGRHTDLA